MSSLGNMLTSRKNRRLILALVLFGAWALRTLPEKFAESVPAGQGQPQASSNAAERAFAEQRSDQWMVTSGSVERVLPDDNKGSRHQRFILRVTPDLSVLVAHNIDLADRVPLEVGDFIELRGEYEWNDQGGVLHWTHHDPKGRREGGWIRLEGKSYR